MQNQTLIPCLQLSPFDADQAIGEAELIAEFSTIQGIEFWICHRRDVDPVTVAKLVAILKPRFNVFAFPGRNFAEGHPDGCNALWTSAMIESSHRLREGWANHEAILTFEADCVPLRPDWIEALTAEWRAKRPAQIVGHMQTNLINGQPTRDHINGNAIFKATLLQDHKTLLATSLGGGNWDYSNRELFVKIGADTSLITQLYGQKTITEEEFIRVQKHNTRPALLHGIKDLSAQKWARKHLFH